MLPISEQKELHHFPFSLRLASFPGANKCTGKKGLSVDLPIAQDAKTALFLRKERVSNTLGTGYL